MRAWLVFSVLSLPACVTREETYLEGVRQHIQRGSVVACCGASEPPGSRCAAEARSRCAYVAGATITMTAFQRLPHDGGAQITTAVRSAKGSGTCTHQILRDHGSLRVSTGTCGPPSTR